jgi:DNA-binding NarL/FixJ family response regulator
VSADGAAAKVRPQLERSGFMGFESHNGQNGSSSRPRVAVCIRPGELRERVCAALAAGDHQVELRVATLDDLLAAGGEISPTCLVAAADVPDRRTVETLQAIRSELEAVAVVLVCRRAGGAHVRRALVLGVDGVVLTDQIEAALAPVVGVVCAGQVSIPSERRGEVRPTVLTNREKEILAYVVRGLTNAQIAHELYLAESTVKSHLSSAFSKLGVSSRHEAVRVILDPERGRSLGIREIRSKVLTPATRI